MLNTALKTQENRSNDYYSVIAKGPMLDRVYSMRYKSYSAEGYIEENSSLKFIDEYDDKPNSTCFLAYHRHQVIGSIRACVYEPNKGLSIPIMECFEKEIRNAIGYDGIFLEPNKFVIDPLFQRKGGIHARFLLLGTAVEQAVKKDASNIVVAVRTEHIKFYQMFGGKLASEEKSYPHLNFKTVLMICTDVQKCRDFIKSKVEVIQKNDPVLNYGTV